MITGAESSFLAVDDYGTGGIWFVLIASNEEEIRTILPTVKVYSPAARPEWMSEQMFHEIADRRTFDIKNLPTSDWMNRLRRGQL